MATSPSKMVYFAEANKSLKRTIYPGGCKRTQRRLRALLKSYGATRSLFEYNFSTKLDAPNKTATHVQQSSQD
ncbi:hypothetical protein V1504DRAFT_459911 [Lipomyces starkeyi]